MYEGCPARRPSGASIQAASSQETYNKRLFFIWWLFISAPPNTIGKLQLSLFSSNSILKRIHGHIRVRANWMIIIFLEVNFTSDISEVR